MSCEECSAYFQRLRKTTPCGPCPKPFLAPANATAWEVFAKLYGQAKVGGMGGVYGFDYAVLPFLFVTYGVPRSEWWIYLDKIEVVSKVALRHLNKATTKDGE